MSPKKFKEALLQNNLEGTKIITLERNEFLITPGQVEQNAYLVKSGALRVIYLSTHEEHTIRFGYEGSLITSLSSFFTGNPSEFYIQALRKTSLFVIPKISYKGFIQQSPEHMQMGMLLLQDLVLQQMEREIDLLTSSPEERYKRILTRSPKLFQEIPSKYIAAYLRMTPETLSRLKKNY